MPLVDAFDHSDKMLDSALGCYDGRVYERMYDWARRAPSNRKQVGATAEGKDCWCSNYRMVVITGYLANWCSSVKIDP